MLIPVAVRSKASLGLRVRIQPDACLSILIRSKQMQQYAGIYLLQNHSVHVLGVHRTHHQEYIKVKLQPLVQVITYEQQPSSNVPKLVLIWSRWRKVVAHIL